MKGLDIHIRQINVNPTGTSLNNLGARDSSIAANLATWGQTR